MNRRPFPTVFESLALVLLVAWFVRSRPGPQELSQTEFIALVNSNLVANIRIHHPPTPGMQHGVPVLLHRVRGEFYGSSVQNQLIADKEVLGQRPFFANVQISEEAMLRLMRGTNVSIVTPNSVIQKTAEFLHLRKS